MPNSKVWDYLIIGSGIAGLTFAINAAKSGSVLIITKKQRHESNTNYAQGGVAAALGDDDSSEIHLYDTEVAGAGLCHRDSVDFLVHEGPRLVRWLQEIGARFDACQGIPVLGREGGHTRNRIVHHADRTGWEIERSLIEQLQKSQNIHVVEHCYALDLIVEDGECLGAYALNNRSGEVEAITAKSTVLATGGCGMVYLHTTNPTIATGDGIAMAYRAGARIGNMEFIQFHPTTLYHKDARSFLISEAVRGEGGKLIGKDGKRFMDKYHSMAELAPRDHVARAIDRELKETGEPCVFLDVTHLDSAYLIKRFPAIHEKLLSVGIDITRDLIPVVPAAHYTCGGVITDLQGQTNIKRLYACGEVSCTGVHGANRLASNSLLEALVFGESSAISARQYITSNLEIKSEFKEKYGREDSEISIIDKIRNDIRKMMWDNVGIVRTDKRLETALNELKHFQSLIIAMVEKCKPTMFLYELKNIADNAQLITLCASNRKESRGLHYTLDWLEQNNNFLSDTIIIGSEIERIPLKS